MNKPQIRFKGFEDEWRSLRLQEIGNTFSGLSGKTKEDFGHGNARFVTYLNVFNNPISCEKQLDRIEIDNAQNQVKYGDVFFTTSSETPEEVGMSSIWLSNIPNVYLNSFCFGFRPSITFDYSYFAYFLRSRAFREQMIVLAQGISRYNISKVKALALPVAFPSEKEQNSLGKFFTYVDEMIAEAEREIRRLEKMKQASLQKMFPRPGATTPEIRFAGFSEPWVIRPVGSCFGEGTERGGFNNLLSVGITRGVYPTEDFIKTVTVKDFSNYKTVHENDIVYNSMRMWQGASGFSLFNGIVSPAYTVLTPKENIWSPFFAYLFKLPWAIKIFEANSQGLTKDTWNLKYPAISLIKFAVPAELKEQIYIAKYFLQLDDLLKSKRQKLAKLRNIKQACLDKMFVNTSEL